MKETYLIFNQLTGNYIFVEGKDHFNPNHREEWFNLSDKEVVAKLKPRLNFKRKTVLHLENIALPIRENLERLCKRTKISLN